MRIHIAACVAGLILAAATAPLALAQTTSGDRLSSQTQRASVAKRLNDGGEFELLCRGGPGLRFRISKVQPLSRDWSLFSDLSYMTVEFQRSTQSPDRTGHNLLPGQCSPADFPLGESDRTRIQDVVLTGSPDSWDKSVKSAERRPDSDNIPLYLQDPKHYWTFTTVDSGEAALQAGESRYWRPEFYKGPFASTGYPSTTTTVGLAATPATRTQVTSSRSQGIATHTEGRAGPPAVPTPALPPPPAPPPPVVVEPAPGLPVTFSPPLLQDGEQLWACVDALAGEADPAACSGAESARAYCQLRDAQSTADVLIADAQPGVPVRAVNGDACFASCRVVGQLQCDR